MASVITDYEPLELIGKGSFGVIRKVKRRSDGQLFARKELDFATMKEHDRKQVVAEVNILKDLKHDNIVKYINRYVDHDTRILYILMEYCGGGDLGAIISLARRNNRPLPEDTVWNYFYQIVAALHHCHFPSERAGAQPGAVQNDLTSPSKQILHRDLKPENIFLTLENEIKLGDFGLSKQIATATFASTYVGTPYYMSPELMMEKSYDIKSDIWSLGCMIYEMCALKAPFHDAQTYNELSTAIRSGRIPPLPKGYSPALATVIKSMLSINPAMRPSTQQLLKNDQLVLARKLIEVNKMIAEIRVKQEHLSAREHTVVTREQAVTGRESAVTKREEDIHAQYRQLGTERSALAAATATAQNQAAKQVGSHSDAAWRAQLEADAATLEIAKANLSVARAKYHQEVQEASEVYQNFLREKERFEREKSEFHNDVLGRMSKPALVDVKNKQTLPLRISRFGGSDETPTRSIRDLSISSKTRVASASPEEKDDTPSRTFTKSKGSNKAGPVPPVPFLAPSALQRLAAKVRPSSPTTSGSPTGDNETPTRLLPSKSITDLGSAMKGVILTDSGTSIPTPARAEAEVPPLPPKSVQRPASAMDHHSNLPERPLPRRKSLTQNSAQRPQMHQAATTSQIPRVPPPNLPTSFSLETALGNYSLANTLVNEEDLPSPFMKKNVDFGGTTLVGGAENVAPATLGRLTGNHAKPRQSLFSSAMKTSLEAKKAIARRQAEARPS